MKKRTYNPKEVKKSNEKRTYNKPENKPLKEVFEVVEKPKKKKKY